MRAPRRRFVLFLASCSFFSRCRRSFSLCPSPCIPAQHRETNLATTTMTTTGRKWRTRLCAEKETIATNLRARRYAAARSRKPPNLMRQRVSNFNQARMDAFEFSHPPLRLTSLNASGRDASEMRRRERTSPRASPRYLLMSCEYAGGSWSILGNVACTSREDACLLI